MGDTKQIGEVVAQATNRVHAAIKGQPTAPQKREAPKKRLTGKVLDYETARGKFWQICTEDAAIVGYKFALVKEDAETMRNIVKYLIDDESGDFDPNKGLCLTIQRGSKKHRILQIIQKFVNTEGYFDKRMRIADFEEIQTYALKGSFNLPNFLFPNLNLAVNGMFDKSDPVTEIEVLKIRRALFFREENPLNTHLITYKTKLEIAEIMGTDFEVLAAICNFIDFKGE